MTKPPIFTIEITLFLLALILALSLRFINLGASSLTDSEAEWALQAHQLVNLEGLRNQVAISPQPAYIFLTGLVFQIFGSTEFLAKFWPALAGSLLIIAIYLIRADLGRKAALIAAFGIALDPGLVSVSRTADGAMMALGFAGLGIAALINQRFLLAGVLTGLALLSGPTIFMGLVCAALTVFLFSVYLRSTSSLAVDEAKLENDVNGPKKTNPGPITNQWREYKPWLGITGLTILIVGTAFFRYPQGLAAWAQSLIVYLSGWLTPGETSPLKMVTTLLIYQPFGLGFGIIAIVLWLKGSSLLERNSKNAVLICIILLFATFTHSLIYPARVVSDLIWTLVPLWALAGAALQIAVPDKDEISSVSVLQAALILILAALFWITLVSTNNLTTAGEISPSGIRAALLAGILLLGVLTTVLVALGWTTEISRDGFIWGIGSAALIYLISVMWGASQLRPHQPSELWTNPPGSGQTDLIVETLEDLSNKNIGMSEEIEILSTINSPSLRWALRKFSNSSFQSTISPDEMPEVILSPVVEEMPALTSSYRGQDFVWKTWPGWEGVLPEDFISWFTFRTAPINAEKVILWARSDQFPGGAVGASEQSMSDP